MHPSIKKWVNAVKNYQIIEFLINENYYGLDIKHINGIHKANSIRITPIPSFSEAVLGVTNIREQIYPIVDLKRKLGFERTTINDDTKLIIMNLEGKDLGVIVDEVTDIRQPNEEDIKDLQNLTFGKETFFSSIVKGEGHFVIVLDAGKLFKNDEILSVDVEQVLDGSI